MRDGICMPLEVVKTIWIMEVSDHPSVQVLGRPKDDDLPHAVGGGASGVSFSL